MKILIAAGGSGGHLFPALRLAEEIRLRQSAEIMFITSCRRQDSGMLRKKGIKFRRVPIIGLQSGNIFHLFNFFLRLVAGSLESMLFFLLFRPDKVIGFGSYVSGPVVLVAALCRVKTVIHEQNVYPGKTNRILARFVDKIAVSFSETIGYFKGFEEKIFVSGNFLRKELLRRQTPRTGFAILIAGGSQGSGALNALVPEAIGGLSADQKKGLEVFHISGNKDEHDVSRAYREKGVKHSVFLFTEHMDRFYNECDFVIGRSGATTVAELLLMAKPSILIPYPHLGSHQYFNAKLLSDMGGAALLEEKGLRAEDLRDAIIKFMDKTELISMSERLKCRIAGDPCDIFIKEIFK